MATENAETWRIYGYKNLSEILGISQPTLRRYADKEQPPMPILHRGENAQDQYIFDVREILKWYAELKVRNTFIDATGKAPLSLDAERARQASEMANNYEIKNAVLKGELVPVGKVEKALADAAGLAASQLNAFIPNLRTHTEIQPKDIDYIELLLAETRNAMSNIQLEEIDIDEFTAEDDTPEDKPSTRKNVGKNSKKGNTAKSK